MRKNWIAYPYAVWMIIFTVVPLVLIFFYSIFVIDSNGLHITFEHLKRVFDPLYIIVFLRSVKLAVESTVLCLIINTLMNVLKISAMIPKMNIQYLTCGVPWV